MAFKVMQRAFAALSDGRYTVDRSLGRSDLGRLREDFVFVVEIGDRTDEQGQRLDELKAQLAQRVMAAPAAEVYDIA
jgi:hypothetical protein